MNESDEDVVWAIVRSGEEPVVVNLEGGWGSSFGEGEGEKN